LLGAEVGEILRGDFGVELWFGLGFGHGIKDSVSGG
jgi:hypothetical protein